MVAAGPPAASREILERPGSFSPGDSPPDIWRKSYGQNGQNDPKNAGLAPEVPRSVRIVRRLPGAGPERAGRPRTPNAPERHRRPSRFRRGEGEGGPGE